MTILVTGIAGFIGSHLAKNLLKRGESILGIDNLSDYYDVNLKKDRIKIHSIREPSWLPHTPLILYINGLSECELFVTIDKEKSEIRKL